MHFVNADLLLVIRFFSWPKEVYITVKTKIDSTFSGLVYIDQWGITPKYFHIKSLKYAHFYFNYNFIDFYSKGVALKNCFVGIMAKTFLKVYTWQKKINNAWNDWKQVWREALCIFFIWIFSAVLWRLWRKHDIGEKSRYPPCRLIELSWTYMYFIDY